jgi:uncharacterized protein (DUF1778 family)
MKTKDNLKEKNNPRLWTRVPPALMEKIEQLAKADGVSRNELVNKALALYAAKDITDESLLIAKMSEMQRAVQFLDRKIDIAQKLQLEWYQYFFMFQPDAPRDKAEASLLYKKAAEKTDSFVARFRERLPRLPALLEALLADMLEEQP